MFVFDFERFRRNAFGIILALPLEAINVKGIGLKRFPPTKMFELPLVNSCVWSLPLQAVVV